MSKPIRKCRVCGCTETSACSTPDGNCYWVEEDLCSAHEPPLARDEVLVKETDLNALKTMPMIPIALDGVSGLMILSALQLACRHPGMNGSVRETVYDFARGLQELISVTPALSEICEAGWNPAADVPAKPEVEKGSGLILPGDPEFGL